LFLRWCGRTGRHWHAGVEHLALFVTWLRHAPVTSDTEAGPGASGELLAGPGADPVRRARRVNLVLTAVTRRVP
jgi:integrase/recombinase XerD